MRRDWQEAARRGDVERVRLHLADGENIDAKDKYGQTALMIAAHAGHVELVRLLLERGAAGYEGQVQFVRFDAGPDRAAF